MFISTNGLTYGIGENKYGELGLNNKLSRKVLTIN